MSKVRS